MKTLKDFTDYLISKNYTEEDSGIFLDGFLYTVYFHKDEIAITLNVELQENIQKSLKEDDVIPTNPEYYDVIGVLIEGLVVNTADFYNGEKNGIILQRDVDESSYIKHDLSFFEKCVDIQENPFEHIAYLIEQHAKHIRWIQQNLHQHLVNRGYYVSYSSIIDLSEKDSTDLYLDYKNKSHWDFTWFFQTDCITGSLILTIGGEKYDIQNIENLSKFVEEHTEEI